MNNHKRNVDVFNGCSLIREINGLRQEINWLLSKGMSNIYIEVTIEEKNKSCENFDFLALLPGQLPESLLPGQWSVLGSSNS